MYKLDRIHSDEKRKEFRDKRVEDLIISSVIRNFNAVSTEKNRLVGLKNLIDLYVKESDRVLEVGSFAGVSSELFANFCKELHCVDSWKAYQDWWGFVEQHMLDNVEASFDRMADRYSNIVKVKLSSEEASKLYEDGFFDVIYIDAAHDYESVKKDIEIWSPKLKKGGVMAGHDYSVLPEVKKAVDEAFQVEKVFSDSSWLLILN